VRLVLPPPGIFQPDSVTGVFDCIGISPNSECDPNVRRRSGWVTSTISHCNPGQNLGLRSSSVRRLIYLHRPVMINKYAFFAMILTRPMSLLNRTILIDSKGMTVQRCSPTLIRPFLLVSMNIPSDIYSHVDIAPRYSLASPSSYWPNKFGHHESIILRS